MFHAASEAESTPQLKQVQLTDVGRQNGNLQYIWYYEVPRGLINIVII